ncbi:MAG: hypothetical protein KGI06_06225, partial [Candidatus Micrarchaeota archaeon]|nr:hypothetical protein [Candidatus Micrarchaeota archaeon]
MTERVCIDISLGLLWRSWYRFRQGKKRSRDLERFEFGLEGELRSLARELASGRYIPSPYRTFIVADNKRREISVAAVRDRVVHRLLYDYLVPLYDPTFVFDVWSCRAGKGLVGAIERTQELLRRHRSGYVWRSDITKFFDHVDRAVLLGLITRRVTDEKCFQLLRTVISGYPYLFRR